MEHHFVYIVASQRNGTIYTGKTNDLQRRISEHKQKLIEGFTKDYNCTILVYYETYENHWDAAQRSWKLELIEKFNPRWIDLFDEICK